MMRMGIALGVALLSPSVARTQVLQALEQEKDPAAFMVKLRDAADESLATGRRVGAEAYLPSRTLGPMEQMVSVTTLSHRIPKAAKQAYRRAQKLSCKSNSEGAIEEFQRAIALDPAFAAAHNDLGVHYACLGRYQDAEAQFRRTVKLMPESAVGPDNLALILIQAGNREEAESNLRRAMQLAPNDWKAHFLLGRLLSTNSDTREEGLKHLEYAGRAARTVK
jgi:Flp pilus assembly protein TadD